jgi:hypothetical protein
MAGSCERRSAVMLAEDGIQLQGALADAEGLK